MTKNSIETIQQDKGSVSTKVVIYSTLFFKYFQFQQTYINSTFVLLRPYVHCFKQILNWIEIEAELAFHRRGV